MSGPDISTEAQSWPISIPEEPSHDRWLEARAAGDEFTTACWKWNDFDQEWVGFGAPESFYDIVASCGRNGWTLRSLPNPTALDAGTAAMVAKQIESHVTLPAFIQESCQFENVTEGGKDEWRAIFKAGLDAYLAAGGAPR